MHLRYLRDAGLVIFLAFATTAASAQQAQRPASSQQPGEARQGGTRVTPVGEAEARSINMMVEFVGLAGSMAGAASVCEPRLAVHLQRCAQSISTTWPESTGMSGFTDPRAASKLADIAWQRTYAETRDKQSALSTPITCQDVVQRIMASSILQACPLGQPPQGALQQQQARPQQPRQQGGGGLQLQ